MHKGRHTFRARTDDGFQHLLVVEDQDKALGGPDSQRCRDIEARGSSKVALADFGEDLSCNLLQLGPAYYLPWCLWSFRLVWLLLEE
jgi:hypothetical protein